MKNRLNIITITILSLLLTITLLPLSIYADEGPLKPKEPDVSVFEVLSEKEDEYSFSSAAIAGQTGIISSGATKIQRYQGAPEEMRSYAYTLDGYIDIKFASDGISLVVQGKNGDYNWSFSKIIPKISGSKFTVNKSEIIEELKSVEELKNIEDIDLSKCKIWLEKPLGEDISALMALDPFTINKVIITGIDTPKEGNTPDLYSKVNYIYALEDIENQISVRWIPADNPSTTFDPKSDKFDYYTRYTAILDLNVTEDYNVEFPVNPTVTVNGDTATSVTRNIGSNSITVTYTFPYTKDKLISAANPSSINVPNGTSLEDIVKRLPEEVSVETAGKSVSSLDVKWVIPSDIAYDPAKKEAQRITIYGTVELPEDNSILPINNDGPAMVSVDINVSAFEIVPTPAPETGNGNSTGGNNTLIIPDTACK